MSENLKLWNAVQVTDPKFTKKANVKGNNITSICPHYQVMKATEQFGIYGKDWGFKSLDIDYNLAHVAGVGMVTVKGVFFFPGGEFPILNSISLWRDNAMTKADDQFAKKAETDMLTKALSKLGFNADIYLGKYDDERYVYDLKNPPAPTKEELIAKLKSAKDRTELTTAWNEINNVKLGADKDILKAKDDKKTELGIK
jgi:hypothetical protein